MKLPRLISDGMVLQQKRNTHIWGWDEPGRRIVIRFRGKEYEAAADEGGSFSLYLSGLAVGGPYIMEIADDGGERRLLRDIWVGDVWFCSGQSNMELPMARVKDKYPEEILHCDNPAIRTFKIAEHTDFHGPLSDHVSGEWKAAGSDNILDFSAAAYFFAQQMYRMTGVPVGLINASLGGSRMESWMGEDMLAGYEDFLAQARQYADDEYVRERLERNQAQTEGWHEELDRKDRGMKEEWMKSGWMKEDWIKEGQAKEGWMQEIQIPFLFRDTELSGFIGSVWFGRKFTASRRLAGKNARLWLGTIVDSDTVYINGKMVGHTDYQYPPRKYTIPEGLLREGENTIVIRVKCENGQGRFTPGKEYILWNEEETVSLEGQWYYRIGAACEQIPETDFVNWKPTGLYNGMTAPCHNYTVAGILWYQGESNSRSPEDYLDLTERLIRGYREKWKDPALPFFYVQLPNFSGEIYDIDRNGEGSYWAELRECQRRALSIPATGMVVSIDLGEDNDLHPLNKKDIGIRLALLAASKLYGADTACSGPVVRGVKIAPGEEEPVSYRLTLSCDGCGGGMYAYSAQKGSEIKDFEVLDEVGRSGRVKARLQGECIILDCRGMDKPPAILRYCYGNTNKGALIYNKSGFPMSPFIIRLDE